MQGTIERWPCQSPKLSSHPHAHKLTLMQVRSDQTTTPFPLRLISIHEISGGPRYTHTHTHILVDWSILIISWRLWRALIRSRQCDWWRHAMLSPRERRRDREKGWPQLWTPLLLCPHLFIVRVFLPCNPASLTASPCVSVGKPVMIITEFMENGSLDTFLKVSHGLAGRNTTLTSAPSLHTGQMKNDVPAVKCLKL